MDAAAVDVERLLAAATEDLAHLRFALARRSGSARLSYAVTELAANVQLLAGAAVDYDRAAGATWTEVADGTGLDASTLRRRQRQSASGATTPPG